jgi:DNA adenine methylase
MFYSPLRYPGGKNRLAPMFAETCRLNGICGHYIEPYCGGASVALSLIIGGVVERATINDMDRSIYAFWYSVLNYTDKLCSKIESTEITVDEWRAQKSLQKRKGRVNLFNLGFSTLFLNRTSHSGVLNGGIIGGFDQRSEYKIDCRFNREATIEKIRMIASEKRRIQVSNRDALQLIVRGNSSERTDNALFYLDPPYFEKGARLYMNHYNLHQHQEVANAVKSLDSNWVVSYDNVAEIRNVYSWVRNQQSITYSLNHNVRSPRIGNEVMYFSESLKVRPDRLLIGR